MFRLHNIGLSLGADGVLMVDDQFAESIVTFLKNGYADTFLTVTFKEIFVKFTKKNGILQKISSI